MKTVGFVTSHKWGEKRRALLPEDVKRIKNPGFLFFENGYGHSVGRLDHEYRDAGANVVSREEAYECDIITDLKIGDADYLDHIANGKVLFGWAHAVQGIEFADMCLAKKFTVIAWEEMFEDGRHVYYRNNELAGESAVMHAFTQYGKMPYQCKVAVIGNGQTAKGAIRILNSLGAEVDVYGRRLEDLFRKNLANYDVIVNCILWDTSREDHLIYEKDLKRMKRGAMIIDVSCDPHLGIESSHPTAIPDPVYEKDGILHYAVDNAPSIFYKTSTAAISDANVKFVDALVKGTLPDVLRNSIVIENGHILDEKIINFRKSRGLKIQ